MDKKTILGLVLIGAILFGYSFYNSKQQEKIQAQLAEKKRQEFVADSTNRANYPELYKVSETEASKAERNQYEEAKKRADEDKKQNVANLGQALVNASSGEEVIYTLENDVIKMYISSQGAKVANVQLKDYKRYNGEPLMLFKDGSSKFDLSFFIRKEYNYAQINTADYFFNSDQPLDVVLTDGEKSKTLALRLPVDDEKGAYLEYLYTIYPNEYMVDFNVNFVGMREWTANMYDFNIDVKQTSLQNEKGFKNENQYTTVAYHYPGDNSIEELGASDKAKSENVKTKVNWVGFKQQYFSTTIIADESFAGGTFGYNTYAANSGYVKDFSASLQVPYDSAKSDYGFKLYFGPNKYSTLKSYKLKMEKVIPLGGKLFGWVNQLLVIPIFGWLSKFISSYGLIIFILTLIVKLIILPLTYKSYMSTAKMRVLKPEIDEINARYPGTSQDEQLKKQQATMELYKRTGVSPMGGCLPMLIQFPILIAMFRFFPASIELRGQSFLWAEDLSAYDSILNLPFNIPFYGDHVSLFTLMMAVSMFIYSKINYKQTAASAPQMAGMQFMTVYLMPIMMLCWFNSYASGLTYYYLLSNLFTIAQMTGFRYFINEDKLRAKLQSNAAKATTKKKSKFQQRYEEAVKLQQQMREQQAGGGNVKAHTAKPQSTKNQPAKKRKK